MTALFDFLEDATDWTYMRGSESGDVVLRTGHIISVHCKAGKGRTGTICCAWLLYTGECATVDDALALFAERRTDWLKRGRVQGVETKGQIRILRFLHEWLSKYQL